MSSFTLVLCRADGCTGAGHGHGHGHGHNAPHDQGPAERGPAEPGPAGPGPLRHGPVERSPVEQALSEATRRSEHGVLVVTGCLMGQMLCRACGPSAPASPGRVAVVQPCTASHQPSGPAVLVGPIRDTADAAEICLWLRGGTLTADRLPDRLRAYARTLRRAPSN
ncbi:MAG: hypothetical protein QOF38_2326 [Pseudonocardiales bacterium]|nr:hypothetical protein [Pseudonocardiales bacterium]